MIVNPWRRHLASVLVAAAYGGMTGCSQAGVLPDGWKADCVGRMQIGLPGDVEVAALTAEDFQNYVPGKRNEKFQDGKRVFASSLSFMGLIAVSHPVDDAVRKRFLEIAKRTGVDEAKRLKERHGISALHYPATFESLPTAKQKGLAWRIGPSYSAYIEVGESGLWWGVDSSPDQLPALGEYYQTLIEGVSARSLYTVPADPGVCLPYVFIRDDGKHDRKINATYRLREHPDITIWFEDQGAERAEKGRNPDRYSATGRSDFFWMQRYSGGRFALRSLWGDTYKKVSLTAGNGVESFVAMKRADGTEDYGYLLAIRGDPDAKEDRPDLMMYVIRDAANARSKGIEPASQEQILGIGRAVAASIRHRVGSVSETPSK
ncbi:T6SS immunity protein Tli4 family protein [Ralstonia solanacearum]|uniref:T6SS immunity protein Tli4 family protein n=1 Tax=Ralstonia solanacearum TaxID=305 RepID=UPI0006DC67A3|nr:T6SS immunity protein Tli4 family protein [Ralstonia solanacearum]